MAVETQDKSVAAPPLVTEKQRRRYFLMYRLSRMAIPLIGKLDIQGQENVPETGGFILAANHRAHVDPIYLSMITKRHIMWMGKEELFENKHAGAFLRSLGAFAVRRGEPDRAALRLAISLLKGGYGLGIFPEGTRSTDNTLGPAVKGFALMAKQTGAPIVPVAIEGSERILPKGSKMLHRGPVTITVGKPATVQQILDAYDGEIGKDSLEIVGREVMRQIGSLMRAN